MAQEIKKPEMGVVQRYSDPFSAMRSEIDRVFEQFLAPGFGRWPATTMDDKAGEIVPRIDVRDAGSELVIEAELPGLDEKDVSVVLNDGVLTLKGEKKTERDEKKDDYHLMERSYGSFQRSFRVADSVDVERVSARFDKGVLTVKLPKRADAVKAERRIPIKNS